MSKIIAYIAPDCEDWIAEIVKKVVWDVKCVPDDMENPVLSNPNAWINILPADKDGKR